MGLNLEATIGLNSAAFERGLDRAKDKVSETVKGFIIGAIGIGTVEEAFRKTVETATDLVNASQRLGITVEQVQLLRQAAKDAGTEMDGVAAALEKVNIARAKALGGDVTANAAFRALGVSRGDLQTKPAVDLLIKDIGDKVKAVNPEEIAAPLREVLGRGAGESIAFLKTDFDELGDKMQKTGAIMSASVAEKLKALDDQFSIVSQIMTATLGPAILALAQGVVSATVTIGRAVAGLSATFGSMVGQGGLWGTLKALFKTDVIGLGGLLTNTSKTDQQKQITAALASEGIDRNLVRSEADKAQGPWDEISKQFQAMMKAAEDKAKTPAANFNKTQADAEDARGRKHIETDSLVKVGNFLGSNVTAAAERAAAQHAATTAKNTTDIAKHTKATADMLSALQRGLGPRRDAGGAPSGHTSWPLN